MEFQERWQELEHVLKAEQDAYRRFSVLLAEEHEALCRFDPLPLPPLTLRKEELLRELQVLERQRLGLCHLVTGDAENQNPETVRHVFSEMDHPEGRALSEQMTGMLALARDAAKQAKRNATLIFRGLSMVREALRLIHAGGDIAPVYGEGGYCRLPPGPSSLSVEG